MDLRCVECKKDLPRNLIYSHLRGRNDVRDVVNGPAQKRQRVDEEHQESIIESLKQPKLAYPTLPSDMSHQLDAHIQAMKARKQTQVALSQSQSEKTRQSVRDNFTYALLLGSCEAFLSEESENSPKISEAEPKCSEIAKTIESAMYIYFDKCISKDYGKKFRLLKTTL